MLLRFLILASFALFYGTGISAQANESYSVRAGDRITIQLFTAAGQKVNVVEGQRIIDRNGEVFLPYVGTVILAGLDQAGVRNLLTERYEAFYSDPVLDLKVELRVSVTGAVPRPGQFYLDPSATVAEALTLAGGTTPEFAIANVNLPSDPTRVRLVRNGVSTIVNFRAEEVSYETLQLRIKSGDWLHVPYQRRSWIRDEVQFWGSVVALAASSISLIVLLGR
jgi:polysaccharide export outer membrane protein